MTRVPSRSHSSKIYYISETFEIGERFSGKFHGNDHNFHSLRTPANQKFWAAAKFRKTLPGLRHTDIFQILDRRFPSVRRESIVNLRRNFDRRSPSRNPSTIVRFEIYPDDPLIDSPFNADVEKAWNKCWSSCTLTADHERNLATRCNISSKKTTRSFLAWNPDQEWTTLFFSNGWKHEWSSHPYEQRDKRIKEDGYDREESRNERALGLIRRPRIGSLRITGVI